MAKSNSTYKVKLHVKKCFYYYVAGERQCDDPNKDSDPELNGSKFLTGSGCKINTGTDTKTGLPRIKEHNIIGQ